MADEDQTGTSTRRAFVTQLVAGATVLAVASAIPTAAAGDRPPGKTPTDPAPSKSSWNSPVSSPSPVPLPSTSPLPVASSPPRSSTRPNSTDTPVPAQPATPNASFDHYNP